MTYTDGGVIEATLANAKRQVQAANGRAAHLETALRTLADRVRAVDEDLRLPGRDRKWKTPQQSAQVLRGAWIEAVKTLNGDTP